MAITPNPPADYTPSMGNYRELKPFRFWCQKVLPLVYDDSLSYYELLCKVVDYLNKTMEDVDTLHTDVENLHTAYEELQAYVNNYFSTLDVQEEINNKLDAMAESGELSELIVPLLPEPVDEWLAEHITNPSNPPLDTSLTLANAAAPAKTVGDKLTDIYDGLSEFTGVINPTIPFENGGMNSSGLNTDVSNRIRSKDYFKVTAGKTYKYSFDLEPLGTPIILFNFYTTNDFSTPRISNTVWLFPLKTGTVTIPSEANYLRVMVAYQEGIDITVNNFRGFALFNDWDSVVNGSLYLTDPNLNNLITFNKYVISGLNPQNIPTGAPKENGLLEVFHYANGAVLQRLTYTISGYLYIRLLSSQGTWGEWLEIFPKSLQIISVGDPDLNNLTDSRYYVISGNNPTHIPTGAPKENGLVEVYKYPNGAILQRLTYTISGYIYVRLYTTQGVWNDWVEIFPKPLKIVAIGDPNLNNLTDSRYYTISGNNPTNIPTGAPKENGLLEVYKYPNGAIMQRLTYTISGYIYVRLKTTLGVWNDWVEIVPKALNAVAVGDPDMNTLTIHKYYVISGLNPQNIPTGAPKENGLLEVYKYPNGAILQRLTYTISGYIYTRLYTTQGVWRDWVNVKGKDYKVKFFNGTPSEIILQIMKERNKTIEGGGDIAIYNDIIFGFDENKMFVNGVEIAITNGHGNNANFGNTLHGTFPYLYCGSWTKDTCKIYINEVTENSATLVDTLDYSSELTGYLNCCVDEANDRLYIVLTTSDSTTQGVCDFVVSDLSGNIISNTHISEIIPIVQGMKFHNGYVYVLSGDGTTEYPNRLFVLDTTGNVVSASEKVDTGGEFEGIDIYNGNMYIATQTMYYIT